MWGRIRTYRCVAHAALIERVDEVQRGEGQEDAVPSLMGPVHPSSKDSGYLVGFIS